MRRVCSRLAVSCIARALALAFTLSLAACTTGGANRGEVRAVADLPERERAVWEAWVQEDPAWPEIRAEALNDPELAQFLVQNLTRVMVNAYTRSELTAFDSEKTSPFERSRAELVRLSDHSAPVMAALFGVGDSIVATLAETVLRDIGRPAVPAVAEQLEAQETKARLRAATLLGELPHARDNELAVSEALARHLEGDEAWVVRAACALALGQRGGRDRQTTLARSALVRALGDGDPAVAGRAAEGLAHLGDPGAVPALINFLERSSREAQLGSLRKAQGALLSLSGERRERDVRGWRAWWDEYRKGGKRP